MIKRDYFARHSSIITLLLLFVSVSIPTFVQAIGFFGGSTGPTAVATIVVGQAITLVALFICVPIAFFGFVLRLLGFQKVGQGTGWSWHFGQAISRMFGYFIYHLLLFTGLIIIAKYLQDSNRFWGSNPLIVLNESSGLIIVFIFIIILSSAWTYLIYRVRKNYNPLAVAPRIGTYLRLIAWSMVVIIIVTVISQEVNLFPTNWIDLGYNF